MKLLEFEKMLDQNENDTLKSATEDEINAKYDKGEARIVTEVGAIKLVLINSTFSGKNYQLKPKFQRRITWDNQKRSKLIESFIMNIPVPPVFLYETEFNHYQVMDGLQRISAIMDFYQDCFPLEGLSQWKELNGKTYSQLPQKIREGIDRRQLSVITLLKESSPTKEQEESMKKMVFERLNTGGVSLSDQEIRNALYEGPFNDLCIKLSENQYFKAIWGIKQPPKPNDGDDSLIDKNNIKDLYTRMEDVELVLRFFAMRHIDKYSSYLSDFLDSCLMSYNTLSSEQLCLLEKLFEDNIFKLYVLFGSYSLKFYRLFRGKWAWSKPSRMIYDAIMIALQESNINIDCIDTNKQKTNIELLKAFYRDNSESFNGKIQSKKELVKRIELFKIFIASVIKNDENI